MTTPLQLHELTPSPNSVKVRLGLGYKGLAYERCPIALDSLPGNREVALKLSGQPRLPILVHGETVIFDSGAILRYVEANFRDTPRLVPEDYAAFGEMEEWEAWTRTGLGTPIGAVFQQLASGSPDPAALQAGNAAFHEATQRIEDRLGEVDYLAGTTHPTLADLTCVSRVYLSLATEQEARASQILAGMRSALHLGEGRERTRAWAEGLLEHDAYRKALLSS